MPPDTAIALRAADLSREHKLSEKNIARTQPMSRFLRMAVMAGVKSAVQIHINRGDDLNAQDANGMTTLMLSAARNKPAICRLLLDAGADPSLVDRTGKMTMDIALAKGADTVAAMLEAACQAISSCSSPNIAVLFEP